MPRMDHVANSSSASTSVQIKGKARRIMVSNAATIDATAPDGLNAHAGKPDPDTVATPEFHAALNDAEVLLRYAAGNAQLPAVTPANMVQDIVAARQAWQSHRVTATVAIGFWI